MVMAACGDASVGETPSPVRTAPSYPKSTAVSSGAPGSSAPHGGLSPGAGQFGTIQPEPVAFDSGQAPYIYEPPVNPTPVPDKLPAPVSTSATAASLGGVEQWRGLVASIFPAFAVDNVLRVMACESHGNPNATGAAGERGLMQIHPLHFDSSYDPEANLRAAFRISGGGTSWGAWTCKP